MWKFSVVFLYFAVMVNFWSVNCLKEDESAILEAIKPIAEKCASTCGLTKEDYIKYKSDDDMDPCFKKCFLTSTGFLDDNGKYNRKGLRDSMVELKGNKEETTKVLDQIDSCFDAKGENIGDDEESQLKRVEVLFQCLKEIKQ